jgi:ABC-type microcin C transport system permease subunit YejE
MSCVSLRFFADRPAKSLFVILIFVAVAGVPVYAQRQDEDKPLFVEFKGVRLGMPAEEARKKLGSPRDKGDDLDLYVFNDNEAVQVYYDKAKTVSAISIDFMDGGAAAPAPKDILGGEPEKRPDGSAYRLVRYPKAGYWVSYSKTAGSSPTITITMQKIEH